MLDKAHLSRLAKKGLIPRHPDGSYDQAAVRQAMDANLDPVRRKVLQRGVARNTVDQSTPVRTLDDAKAAISMIVRVLQEEGIATEGDVDFAKARTAEMILKARERDLKIAERKKQLVPLANVKQHIDKAFIGYRQAMQRLPSRHASQIAAELQSDPARLDVLLTKAINDTLTELSAPVVRA
jgi:hypothetical protein